MNRINAIITGILFSALAVSALTVTNATQFNRACHLITWTDHLGKARTAYLVNSGDHTGIIQHFTYFDGAAQKDIVTGQPDNDPLNSGFGSTTHHGGTHYSQGTMVQKYVGASMAIFDWNCPKDGVIETVTYTFMDGHDYFQWAQTDDVKNGVTATTTPPVGGGDSRGPYCTINWNGTGNVAQGVEYGATKYYKQPSYNGPWTLSGACDIPYAWEWGDGLEIGYIQTRTRLQQLAGAPVLSNQIPASGSSMDAQTASLTDYQMNFYDQWVKITWGMPYNYMCSNGGVGTGQKPAGGQNWGQYSLSIVLDSKTAGGVMRIMKENRALHNGALKVAATSGTLVTSGPMGTRNPNNAALAPAGYDHNFRAFWVTAAGNSAALTFTITSDTVRWVNPVIRMSGMTALPTIVTYNGTALVAGTGYYASFNAAANEVWLVLNRTISGATNTLVIGEPSGVIQKPEFTARNQTITIGTGTLRVYNGRGVLVAQKTIGSNGNTITINQAFVRGLFGNLAGGSYLIKSSVNGSSRQFTMVL